MDKIRLFYQCSTSCSARKIDDERFIYFIIPVQSIYEAALIKCNINLTHQQLDASGVIPYCDDCFILEVCTDEKNDVWDTWRDENGNDNIETWLKENEPEHYAHIEELRSYYHDWEEEWYPIKM